MFTFRMTDGESPTIAMFNGELVAVVASLGFAGDDDNREVYEKTGWFLFNDCMGTINQGMLQTAWTSFLEENWSKVE